MPLIKTTTTRRICSFLPEHAADLLLTVKSLVWAKEYEWETFIPAVESHTSGRKVTEGDTIRYQRSSSHLSPQDKVYLVIKTEQHYFEIVVKADKEDGEYTDRKVIKYIDIGYHLGLEVWAEPASVNRIL